MHSIVACSGEQQNLLRIVLARLRTATASSCLKDGEIAQDGPFSQLAKAGIVPRYV
jgi:hypothetical protein